MSFSMQVKDELVKIEYDKSCCKRSLLYGMCLFGKTFKQSGISLQTENENVANLYASLFSEVYNIAVKIERSAGGRNYTATVDDKRDRAKVLASFGHVDGESLKINVLAFDCEECQRAFVAGAFLSCGTISSPEKDYHLEFSVPYFNLSKSLLTLLEEMELKPKYQNRRGYNVIYFKESESIEDCLYLMGASNAMFEMINVEIMKDIRNKANRKANCETANITRTVDASANQIRAIKKIWAKKGKSFLPENLEAVAELRTQNPELSLSELAKLCNPTISRSGLNHRLNKIVEISKDL